MWLFVAFVFVVVGGVCVCWWRLRLCVLAPSVYVTGGGSMCVGDGGVCVCGLRVRLCVRVAIASVCVDGGSVCVCGWR